MQLYGGMEVQLHEFLTLVLEGGEWLASRTTKEPWHSLDRRLSGPQSRSGCCGEVKNPALSGFETWLCSL
jgi:hypothetical protein